MTLAPLLARAKRLALQRQQVDDELNRALQDARSAGYSLREIAAATGLSVMYIQRRTD